MVAGKTPAESKTRKRPRREADTPSTRPSSRRLSFTLTAKESATVLPGEKDEKTSLSIQSGDSLSKTPDCHSKFLNGQSEEEFGQPKMKHEAMNTCETASTDIPVLENPMEQDKANPAEGGTKIQPEEHVPRFAFRLIFFFKI